MAYVEWSTNRRGTRWDARTVDGSLVGYVWRVTATPGRYLAVLVTGVGDRVVGDRRNAEEARSVVEEKIG